VPAGAYLIEQAGLDLLGLAHRGLGLAGNLVAHVPLAACQGIAASVDLDLEAGTSLADHGASVAPRHAPGNRRMTRE
jgi:hypothetical protein